MYGLFCYSCICEQVKSVVRKKSSNVSLQRLQQHLYKLQGDVEEQQKLSSEQQKWKVDLEGWRTQQNDINISNMIQMDSFEDRLAGVNN